MALHHISRVFRPKTFFRVISLLTATEFITITLLINKVEGVYGILALFTGYHLSALQLSMYIYSIFIFGLVCYLGPHIRRQSPLQNLVLAWIYILDTVINAAYTALFGLGWFILLAQHLNPSNPDQKEVGITPPGGKTINDTSGFTDPEHNVDKVEIIATPRPDKIPSGQDAVVHAVPGDSSSFGHAVFQSGSIMSITIISMLWFIRLYFVIIMMAYARGVLRQTIATSRPHSSARKSDSASVSPSRAAPHPPSPRLHVPSTDQSEVNPFHETLPNGQGWQGRLGRLMVRFPSNYWLGRDEADEEWVRGADERFRRRTTREQRASLVRDPPAVPSKGTGERERRARSGTGPPPPGLDVRSPRTGVGRDSADGRSSGEI